MADPITPAEIHAAELAALRDEVDQQRTRAEAAEAELRQMRKNRDAALLILPAGCGTLADAADTLRQERDNLEAANRHLRERLERAETAQTKLRDQLLDARDVAEAAPDERLTDAIRSALARARGERLQ